MSALVPARDGAAAPSHTAEAWVALLERGPLCGAGAAVPLWVGDL